MSLSLNGKENNALARPINNDLSVCMQDFMVHVFGKLAAALFFWNCLRA
jgi:hypothetical protein